MNLEVKHKLALWAAKRAQAYAEIERCEREISHAVEVILVRESDIAGWKADIAAGDAAVDQLLDSLESS